MRPSRGSFLRGGFLAFIVVRLFLAGEDLLGDQAGILADRGLDLAGHVRIVLEEGLHDVAAAAAHNGHAVCGAGSQRERRCGR